jgi:transcription-repair coupling factor (superfamily II helicase)
MSATLDVDAFVRYFSEAGSEIARQLEAAGADGRAEAGHGVARRHPAFLSPAVVTVPGRQYPVAVFYTPEPVENLLQVVAIKLLCRAAGVEKLDAGPKGIVLGFFRNQPRNPAGMVQWVAAQKGLVRLRPDHKLALLREMELPQRVRVAKELLGALARVAAQAKAA